jgi:hypothetical protein
VAQVVRAQKIEAEAYADALRGMRRAVEGEAQGRPVLFKRLQAEGTPQGCHG